MDVVGFPTVGSYAPELQDAILRRIGVDEIHKPMPLSPGEALRGNFARDSARDNAIGNQQFHSHGAELIQVEGQLTGYSIQRYQSILSVCQRIEPTPSIRPGSQNLTVMAFQRLVDTARNSSNVGLKESALLG